MNMNMERPLITGSMSMLRGNVVAMRDVRAASGKHPYKEPCHTQI
jgi:hypothetical protein